MNAYAQQHRRRISQMARERVNRRWDRVRAEQLALQAAAERDPLRQPWAIRRRIIIVESDGVTAHELVWLACETVRAWKKKLQRHGLTIAR